LNTMQAILVEDEATLRMATAQTLELGGFQVQACASAEEALAVLRADFGGVIVTDVRLPGRSGLELLAQVVALDSELPVIVVTGHGDVSMAVEAMRSGAYDFIEKPFSSDRLMDAVRRAQERRRLVLENRQLRTARALHPDTPDLIGRSPAIEQLRLIIRNVGPAGVDILINGQTGTGKEVVARVLHAASGRKGNFVAINCGALPESVFESEIFGHEAGAFTGAQKRRIGKLEYANGGTVFLDEIESMPLSLQVKLLRVLETREVAPLGTNEVRALDLRVVAASKVDLGEAAARGEFREDLFYRLNVVTVRIPPLRERRGDIPLLFAHFLHRAAARFRRPAPEMTAAVERHLLGHDWPGNVRELSHFAERFALGLEAAEEPAPPEDRDGTLPERVERYEAGLIRQALENTGGDVRATLAALGIPRKTFYDKLARHGIDRARFVRQE
jgi:two-component system, NtrC family, C4-dicarboxylate transport response regulator DctD